VVYLLYVWFWAVGGLLWLLTSFGVLGIYCLRCSFVFAVFVFSVCVTVVLDYFDV